MTAKEQKLGYDSGNVSALDKVKRFASRNGALIGLIILCIILSIAAPAFLTGPNMLNVGIQAATVAILAFGQTFVIVEAGIDLSVGSVAARFQHVGCLYWRFHGIASDSYHLRGPCNWCSVRCALGCRKCLPETAFLHRNIGDDVCCSRPDSGYL